VGFDVSAVFCARFANARQLETARILSTSKIGTPKHRQNGVGGPEILNFGRAAAEGLLATPSPILNAHTYLSGLFLDDGIVNLLLWGGYD